MTVVRSPGSSTLTIEGIPFSGPTFAAAQKACKFFGGRRGRPQVSENEEWIQLHFAQCMRKHGVPNFPDPTFPPAAESVSRTCPDSTSTRRRSTRQEPSAAETISRPLQKPAPAIRPDNGGLPAGCENSHATAPAGTGSGG